MKMYGKILVFASVAVSTHAFGATLQKPLLNKELAPVAARAPAMVARPLPYSQLASPPPGFSVTFSPDSFAVSSPTTNMPMSGIMGTTVAVVYPGPPAGSTAKCETFGSITALVGAPGLTANLQYFSTDLPRTNNGGGYCSINSSIPNIILFRPVEVQSVCSQKSGSHQYLKKQVRITANNNKILDDRIFNIDITCECLSLRTQPYNETNPIFYRDPVLFIGSNVQKNHAQVRVAQDTLFEYVASHTPVNTAFSGALPPGTHLEATPNRIKLSGTPTTEGNYTFTVRLSDTCGLGAQFVDKTFTVPVRCSAINYTQSIIPGGRIGTPYKHQFQTSCDTRYTTLEYQANGLPPGLSISPTGVLSGTPTTAGSYNVTINAYDRTIVGLIHQLQTGSLQTTMTISR